MKPLAPVHERQGGRVGGWRSALEDLLPDRQADHDRAGDDDPAGRSSDPSATKRRPVSEAYVETFLFGSVVPMVMLWFASQGPWAPYVLPILYLAPLILGLRYGFAAGAAGAVLTAVSFVLVSLLKPDAAFALPRAQAIGLVLVGMVAGQASEIWAARIRRLGSLARYHQTRLEQFTSAYHLLKISHAQLEQRVAGGTRNLRNALEGLKNRVPLLNVQGGEPLGGIAEELLGIMVEQGDLYTAAVYALNERSLLRLPALARAGDAPELSVFNPLLRETMRTGMLTSVKTGGEVEYEHVIAVVPLVDSSGYIHGVVVINDMPFLAVNADTFGVLGVLGKHIGDILARLTHPIHEADSAASLRDSLERYLVDARQHGIPTAFLACRIFDVSRRELLVTHCESSGRGLDQSWIAKDWKGHPVIFMLLPLTDESGATTFARRLQQQVVGGQSAKSGMVNHLWMLDQYSHTDKMLAEVYTTCHIEGLDAVHPVQHVGPSTEAAS
jgi:hypothetical protein